VNQLDETACSMEGSRHVWGENLLMWLVFGTPKRQVIICKFWLANVFGLFFFFTIFFPFTQANKKQKYFIIYFQINDKQYIYKRNKINSQEKNFFQIIFFLHNFNFLQSKLETKKKKRTSLGSFMNIIQINRVVRLLWKDACGFRTPSKLKIYVLTRLMKGFVFFLFFLNFFLVWTTFWVFWKICSQNVFLLNGGSWGNWGDYWSGSYPSQQCKNVLFSLWVGLKFSDGLVGKGG